MYAKMSLFGEVVTDVQTSVSASGVSVAHFTVSSTRRWRNESGEQQRDIKTRITAWRGLADWAAANIQKGSTVYVSGVEIEAAPWTDREGKPRASVHLTTNRINVAGARGEVDQNDLYEVIVAGYLGKDPTMRYTPAGQAVTSFTLATSRRSVGSAGEAEDRTTWFQITAWDKAAEIVAEHLTKGRAVLIEGAPGASAYRRQDGELASSLEITLNNFRFLPNSHRAEGAEAAPPMADEPEPDFPF